MRRFINNNTLQPGHIDREALSPVLSACCMLDFPVKLMDECLDPVFCLGGHIMEIHDGAIC